jgi:ABC-type nitrate/sulfonate/bicarbonate transport system substrate-binding protein
VRINNCAPRPLTVNTQTLQEHPLLVERFLRRVLQVGQWAKNNPAEAVTQIAQETNWTEPWVRFAYGPQVHESLGVDLDDKAIWGLGVFKDFLFREGFLQSDFNLNDWIDPQPLQKIQTRQEALAA